MSVRCLVLFVVLFGVCFGAGRGAAAQDVRPGPYPVEEVPFGTADTTATYLALPVPDPQAVLVLLPGFNGDVTLALTETALPYVAASRGVATLVIPTRFRLSVDAATRAFIDTALTHAAGRYGWPLDRTVVGGFSAGGILALSYAAQAKAEPGSTATVPRAVFSIDAPVDLAETYRRFEREIERACSEAGVGEAAFILPRMRAWYGTPQANPEAYAAASPYTHARPDGGNARYLVDLPVRLYHDPAILWQLENRCRSLYDNNVTDASALVNTLRRAGSRRAELVLAEGRGYRARGERHPHTWALVEPGDLVTWILEAAAD